MQKAIKKSWKEEWLRCKPYIVKAVKYQDAYTIDDIEDKIGEGIFLLWPGKNSAPYNRICSIPHNILQ